MKHSCRNCHFLTKVVRSEDGVVYGFSWSQGDRDADTVSDAYSAKCFHGIWDSGIDPSITARLRAVLEVHRRNDCFFIEVTEGMSFAAASELERRRQEHAQLRKSNRYTQWGLWIAALALVASIVVEILD